MVLQGQMRHQLNRCPLKTHNRHRDHITPPLNTAAHEKGQTPAIKSLMTTLIKLQRHERAKQSPQCKAGQTFLPASVFTEKERERERKCICCYLLSDGLNSFYSMEVLQSAIFWLPCFFFDTALKA